ncbi:MAG: 2-phospho-L-lactate transferase [Rhodospirillaceae bacterium]|nr:2-phospho-L-lactate transferase [Rhodospirillaceae bacterium]
MILVLTGGVGGAKLANGLAHTFRPEELTIVVNTGDDFMHLSYFICPDLDSTLYKLAGINDLERGWGIRQETWNFMNTLKEVGGADWFKLGDKDLATHIDRTKRLSEGQTLSDVTQALCRKHNVSHSIVPMTDHRVGTIVDTVEGDFFFQDYFVRLRCKPIFTGVHYKGIKTATPSPKFRKTLTDPDLRSIVICPSNPFVSIDPILNVPGVRDLITSTKVPIVAVSPIIAGEAVKGPAAKMMREIGLPSSPLGIAEHYGKLINGIIIDERDASLRNIIAATGLKVKVCQTLMQSDNDEKTLAIKAIKFAETLSY